MKIAMYFAVSAGILAIAAGIFFLVVGYPKYLFINCVAAGACFFAASMCKDELDIKKRFP